jgi:hypothetical protein
MCGGPLSRKKNIYVDEVPVNVTLNLFCALRYLRQLDRVLILWVDALVSLYNFVLLQCVGTG